MSMAGAIGMQKIIWLWNYTAKIIIIIIIIIIIGIVKKKNSIFDRSSRWFRIF